MFPDLIVHNARIAKLAGDRGGAPPTALCAWNGRIVALGRDDDLLPAASGARVVDAGGRFVCPGFTDSHVHLSSWAMLQSGRQVDLEGAGSLAEAVGRLGAAVGSVPPGGWLRGRGWDKNRWPEGRFPTAADLDAVTGEVPAALPSHDGHSLWVNTAAMRIAGVTAHTPEPAGGRILRGADGVPNGLFQEAANGLVWRRVPEPSVDELTAALAAALPRAAALGLVAVHNCEGGDSMEAVRLLREQGTLSLRIVRYPPAEVLPALSGLSLGSGFGDEWMGIGGVKAFLDGALGAQTAAMLAPYEAADDAGVLTMEPEELLDLIRRATEASLAVALHAIGDRAVRMALDAFETVKRGRHGAWPRHRIEHAQHLTEEDVPRFARLGIVASMQPAHMLADIDTCLRHVGDRSRWAFPLASLAASGAVLAFGSDAPVETMDPLVGLRSAVTRRRWDGTPVEGWYPEQRLTVEQALAGYTTGPAYAAGRESLTGTLEPGKLADFVLLSADPRAVAAEELEQVRVVATVVGGRATYDPEGLFGAR